MNMDSGTGQCSTGGNGYRCQQCGVLVPWNCTHDCRPSYMAPNAFAQPGTMQWFAVEQLANRFIEAMNRLASALEKSP